MEQQRYMAEDSISCNICNLFSWLFRKSPAEINGPEPRGRGDLMPLPEPLVGLFEFERIWATVTDPNSGIVGIHGKNIGIGLTTLLNYLNNQFLILQQDDDDHPPYDYVFICHTVCTTSSIRDRIARQIGLSEKDDWKYALDFHVKARLLHEELEGKRYVLLMDEAESPYTPSAIGVPHPNLDNGCKFIFTTLSQKVCRDNKPDVFEQLNPLSSKDSSTLFFQIIRMENDGDEFANVGSQMVGLCFGLPKVIVVVAGLMALNKNIKQWQNELHSMTELHHEELSCGLSRFKCDFAEDYYFNITFSRELDAGNRPLTSDITPRLRGEEGKRLLAIRQWAAKYVMSEDMRSYILLTGK